jgi:hypothetical protein
MVVLVRTAPELPTIRPQSALSASGGERKAPRTDDPDLARVGRSKPMERQALRPTACHDASRERRIMGGEPGRRGRDPPSRCPGSFPTSDPPLQNQRHVWPPELSRLRAATSLSDGFGDRERGKKLFTTRGVAHVHRNRDCRRDPADRAHHLLPAARVVLRSARGSASIGTAAEVNRTPTPYFEVYSGSASGSSGRVRSLVAHPERSETNP